MSEAEISRLEKRLAREVAARKQAEQIAEKGLRDLFLANQNLDQRVTERTLELQSARTELELAALQREAFLASLSRQVRTPLNGVIGMLDLLEGHVAGPQERSYVSSARHSADELLRLFTRLILFVDLDEGVRVEPTEIRVSSFLSAISERWSRLAMASGQLLFVEDNTPSDCELFTIGLHLEQLLGEVIDNSISHCGPGTLTVKATEAGDHILFAVTDPGGAGMARPYTEEGMGFALAERLAATIAATIEMPDDFDGPSTVVIKVRSAHT